jgi:hypothetical protein
MLPCWLSGALKAPMGMGSLSTGQDFYLVGCWTGLVSVRLLQVDWPCSRPSGVGRVAVCQLGQAWVCGGLFGGRRRANACLTVRPCAGVCGYAGLLAS